MEDLYEATHENVQLAVRDGYDALYRGADPRAELCPDRHEALAEGCHCMRRALARRSSPTSRWPSSTKSSIEGWPRLTPFTITDGDFLRRDLAQVRKRGFSTHTRTR